MGAASLGLDFGTTNTVATIADETGAPRAFQFEHDSAAFSAFRSVLCFWKELDEVARGHQVDAGPWAIDAFLELGGDCRFIQSFKSFAASPLFTETAIFGESFTFERLMATFLRRFRDHAGRAFPTRVVVGRPVTFAGAQPDAALARTRYEAALKRAGFEEIHHVYEPAAAAYFFAQRLRQDATVLVADFGGGTSDFSIVRFTPRAGGFDVAPLAHEGVGVAGDTFDFRIVDKLVAPMFGKGSYYKSWDKVLPLPNAYFTKFARWNQLSVMRHTRDYTELKRLARMSLEPERLEAFVAFLDAEAGYALNRAVTEAKMRLSQAQEATLSLHVAGVDIERRFTRADFEAWIAQDLAAMASSVDEAMAAAGLGEAEVDKVFLTGGSSFVPAVRALFETRFGPDKVESGDQLVSIAYGLALIAREEDVSRWAA
jgi:hypothetical chaperone protein